MSDSDLNQLTPDSTLEALKSYTFQVPINTVVQVVSERFQEQPQLPGVIVTERGRVVGLISQRRFLERMSQPYGLEVYLKGAIQVLLSTIKHQPLQLPITCKIEQAARIALSRPADTAYEPIILLRKEQFPRLLDIHDLLLAQNQALICVNKWYRQQREQANQYLEELKENVERIQSYVQMLEFKQEESHNRNQLLERQMAELRQQAQKINNLNQQLIRIGDFLSLEGKKAFKANYESVKSISFTTEKIILTSDLLMREVEAINLTNKLIGNVSKQVQHLALKATIAVNRAGGKLTELSYIANEIRSLASKTFEANTQVNRIYTQFRLWLPELTEVALAGEVTARSLIQNIQQTQTVLNELEVLVNEHKSQEPQIDFGDSHY